MNKRACRVIAAALGPGVAGAVGRHLRHERDRDRDHGAHGGGKVPARAGRRGGRLAGIASIGDVVNWRLDELKHESAALREYIATD
ncbi:hypothetical protein [Bradyrhizobium sp.]|uniref:hypothetical protein n=1 Tax=Bradyrhizobium sp. TaxID=376 RepID=UPI003C73DE51